MDPMTPHDMAAHHWHFEASPAWDDLRSRLPMTVEDAYRVLESESEMRGEFGMGYVCGGGYAHDVGAAYHLSQTPEWARLVAEANATVELHRPWSLRAFPLPWETDPDLPF